jgi:hypothetical protein
MSHWPTETPTNYNTQECQNIFLLEMPFKSLGKAEKRNKSSQIPQIQYVISSYR